MTDAGLDELTSDVLGPSPEPAQAEPETPTAEEPTEAQPQAEASAEAPTPEQAQEAAPEPQFSFAGKTYTAEQINAALTTAMQFPHLQAKYLELKQAQDQYAAQQQQAQQAQSQQAQPRDPRAILAQIRGSFDGAVQQAVREGFIEEDFATLYPSLAASMVMYRDLAAAMAGAQQETRDQLNAIREEQARERQEAFGRQFTGELENNLLSLATQHQFFQPLSGPEVRREFLGYLQKMNLQLGQMRDPEILGDLWVAYRKKQILTPTQQVQADKVQKAKVAADAKRRAVTDVGGSRPPAAPQSAPTPLDEMIADHFSR